jgi:hypothetical protein
MGNKLPPMSETWCRETKERHEREGTPRGPRYITRDWRLVPGEPDPDRDVQAIAEREYGPPQDAHGATR